MGTVVNPLVFVRFESDDLRYVIFFKFLNCPQNWSQKSFFFCEGTKNKTVQNCLEKYYEIITPSLSELFERDTP